MTDAVIPPVFASNNFIIGHEPDSTPIFKKDLIRCIKAARAKVKSGKYISQEDIEKEIENW